MHWSNIIWLIGLIVMIYFSIRDLLRILDEYENNNFSTQLQIVEDITEKQPNLVQCLPQYSNSLSIISSHILKNSSYCEECDGMKNNSWDVWNDKEFPNDATVNETYFQTSIVNAIIKKLLNNQENGFAVLKINYTNFNWNQPIVDAIWTAIACIAHRDFLLLDQQPIPAECTGINILIDIVPRKTIDTLYDLLFNAIRVYAEPYIFSYDPPINWKGEDSWQEAKLSTDQLIFKITTTNLCVNLLENITAEGIGFYIESSDDDDEPNIKPPWKRFRRRSQFSLYDNFDVLFSTVKTSEALYSTAPDVLEQTVGEAVQMVYSVANKVIERRPNEPCSKISSPVECLANFRVQQAIKYCGCIPFVYLYLTRNLSDVSHEYCNATIYDGACLNKINEDLPKHKDFCNQKCEHIFHSWRIIKQRSRDTLFYFYVFINPLRVPFVEFSVNYRYSTENFISLIGNIVGFYLDFSGTSLCIVIIYLINKYKKRRQSKNTIVAISDQNQNQPKNPGNDSQEAVLEIAACSIGLNAKEEQELRIMKHEIYEEFEKEFEVDFFNY